MPFALHYNNFLFYAIYFFSYYLHHIYFLPTNSKFFLPPRPTAPVHGRTGAWE
jgi:hypothetical protein